MGKKSRRPNRNNKPKDIPAAASTAAVVAALRQVITSATDNAANLLFTTYNQLCVSRDWEGLLELESEMSAFAKTSESSHPSLACGINYNLGAAHKEMGREGGIEQASLYFGNSIKLARKAGDNEVLTKGMLSLATCYVKMGRVDEAMDLYMSLCEEIGKESMDPGNILAFAENLQVNHETSQALTILKEYLEVIARSWGKRDQCGAYYIIARLYHDKNDFTKSNDYFERQLSIAKETKNVESEHDALHGLGHNYGSMGEYDNAMECLK